MLSRYKVEGAKVRRSEKARIAFKRSRDRRIRKAKSKERSRGRNIRSAIAFEADSKAKSKVEGKSLYFDGETVGYDFTGLLLDSYLQRSCLLT